MVKIGIIGGVGPIASANFLTSLLYRISRDCDLVNDSDFPEIIYCSKALPNVTVKGINSPDFSGLESVFIGEVEYLYRSDCNYIIPVCVSISNIIEKLNLKYQNRIINFAGLTNLYIDRSFEHKRILVLASDYTRKARLFQSSKNEIIYITDEEQSIVDDLIWRSMAGQMQIKEPDKVKGLILKYEADQLVLGCTELPVLFKNINVGCETINPLELVNDIIVNDILKDRKVVQR